jgi:hypothetical protein
MSTSKIIDVVLADRRPGDRDIPGVCEGTRVSATVLRFTTRRSFSRVMISWTPADGLSRREFQGPILPGPYAAPFELSTVIDNDGGTGAEIRRNEAAGLEHLVEDGDLVRIDGYIHTVSIIGGHLYLDLA